MKRSKTFIYVIKGTWLWRHNGSVKSLVGDTVSDELGDYSVGMVVMYRPMTIDEAKLILISYPREGDFTLIPIPEKLPVLDVALPTVNE